MSKCSYCGRDTVHGPGCMYGPNGLHVHEDCGSDECIYCGSHSYGPGCLYSLMQHNGNKIHVHGHGEKCIYCGSTNHGPGCLYSPDGRHHF